MKYSCIRDFSPARGGIGMTEKYGLVMVDSRPAPPDGGTSGNDKEEKLG